MYNLTFVSFLLNIVGTILLALAANKYFKTVELSFEALETSLNSITDFVNNKSINAVNFQGMNIHRKKGLYKSKILTYFSLTLLVTSTLIQLYIYL